MRGAGEPQLEIVVGELGKAVKCVVAGSLTPMLRSRLDGIEGVAYVPVRREKAHEVLVRKDRARIRLRRQRIQDRGYLH